MNEQIYTNYHLLLPDQAVLGTVVVRDGRIAEIQPGTVSQGQDGGGDYLMPGLIELHTDNLERCISPRPKVSFPLAAAVAFHDRDVTSAGITTVCDAIAIGDFAPNSPRLTMFQPMIDAIHTAQRAGQLTCDHRLHLRCELSYAPVAEVVATLVEHPLLSMVSLMDHTPGQRQFVNLDKYKAYEMGKYGYSEAELDERMTFLLEQQQRYADPNRQTIVELVQGRGCALASHDDATVAHVQEAIANGVTIAEFPTTLDAAEAARAAGLQILMGAPNLVLGGSHSGNISALELAMRGLVDVFSSDYMPQSLLQSVFLLAQKLDQPLYQLIHLVTRHPAEVIHLGHDRGSLEVGKRADLVTVRDDGEVPRLTSVMVNGRRVA